MKTTTTDYNTAILAAVDLDAFTPDNAPSEYTRGIVELIAQTLITDDEDPGDNHAQNLILIDGQHLHAQRHDLTPPTNVYTY